MLRKTIPLCLLLTVIATASLGVAQRPPSAEGQVFSAGRLLTNESIVRLTQADVSQETILHVVNTQAGSYALGVDDIIALKRAGVSDRVLEAMLDHSAGGCYPPMTVPMEILLTPPAGNSGGQPPSPRPIPTPHSGPSKSVRQTGANATIQGTQAPVYHYGTGARTASQNAH
jgi:hypothetical protein